MDRRQQKKQPSGAEGRKKRKRAEEEAKKSSQAFLRYFDSSKASTSTMQSEELPGPSRHFSVTASSEATSKSVEKEEEEEILTEETVCELQSVEMEEQKEIVVSAETEPDKPEHEELAGKDSLTSSIPEVILQRDVGLLKFNKETGTPVISDALRMLLIKKGSSYFQNSEGPFKPSWKDNRRMTKGWFEVKKGDGSGEAVTRTWLLYSPSKGAAFCFCCLLFARPEQRSAFEMESGFDQWKRSDAAALHEVRSNHVMCLNQCREMEKSLALNRGLIDSAIQTQLERETQRWRDIVARLLDIISYFAIQNLPFRGHRESCQPDHVHNAGNFLEMVKLMSRYDSVLKGHLTHIQSNPHTISYLSPLIQNELIHLKASVVRQNILKKIRSARYYGMMFDSTPDLAHRDQLSEVIRYVEIDARSREVHVRESFLGFIWILKKDAESLTGEILKQLEKDNLDLKDCRSQCYDNAAVMAGLRSGVQQRILEKNHLAVFVNCDNHSLNLVGVHASSHEVEMGNFFTNLDCLYTFFANSDLRWAKLKQAIPVTLKSQSETRWSARTEAVKPVRMYLEEIINLLQDMESDMNMHELPRHEAGSLLKNLLHYEFLTYIGFWDKVLRRIDLVQRRLQSPKVNFHHAAQDVRSLRDYFDAHRDVLVSESLDEGLALCQKFDVVFQRRVRYVKVMPGEKARDAGLTAKEEIQRSMKAALDRIHREMNDRFTRLHSLDNNFGFLLDSEKLCYQGSDREDLQLKEKCVNLSNFYRGDVDGLQLYEDILNCRMLLRGRDDQQISSPEELLNFIVQLGDETTFLHLRVAIQILLTIAVSIASCERSFSKLKLILSYLRATMGQERLSDLAVLSVEREEHQKANLDDLINTFAVAKARKVPLM